MLTLIDIVILNALPLFVLLVGIAYYLIPDVELDDQAAFAIDVDLANLKLEVELEDALLLAEESRPTLVDVDALNSTALLQAAMADAGMDTYVVGDVVVVEDDFRPTIVENVAPTFMILSINDKDVQAANLRDGLAENTIVEMPTEVTVLLPESLDDMVSSLVSDLLAIEAEEVLAGSDEATFFHATAWDDNLETVEQFENAETVIIEEGTVVDYAAYLNAMNDANPQGWM